MDLVNILKRNKIIPGVKDFQGLRNAAASESELVFVLFGDILNIPEIVDAIKASGKYAFVNVDLIEGGSGKDVILKYLRKNTKTDGILSSKASVLRKAGTLGFPIIHRFFIIDSFSFRSLEKQVSISQPDVLEILPGWPKLVSWTREKTELPIISGGMVCTHEDAEASLSAGAVSISTTNDQMWPGKRVVTVKKKLPR